jgi:GNAT superfamily N-acetyltransferase
MPNPSIASMRVDDATGLPEPRVHQLGDGTQILIRPLTVDDREELRARYLNLSPNSRRLRFVSAPERLSERLLDHLLDVDFDQRCAVVAALADEPDAPGVGIARYARHGADPSVAEAAVTVLDSYQGRGIGTLLLTELVELALINGVRTFTADVMWENRDLLDSLRTVGAEVKPGEPGSASIRVGLPGTTDELLRSPLYEVLRAVGTSEAGLR